MRNLHWYVGLPWTIRAEIRKDKGTYYVVRVHELPGLLVTGKNAAEVDKNFWEALESHLLSYLKENEEPPIPQIVKERLDVQPLPPVQESGRPARISGENTLVWRKEKELELVHA